MLGAILSNAGYTVIEAGEGRQACEEAARHPEIRLVITDLIMPEQEGLETLAMLKKQRPSLRTIAVSGAFGGVFLQAARNLGATRILQKPIESAEFIKAVQETLSTPDLSSAQFASERAVSSTSREAVAS